MKQYLIYADGACSNNGRPEAKAGWAIVAFQGDAKEPRVFSGKVFDEQTNNRAELFAAIKAVIYVAVQELGTTDKDALLNAPKFPAPVEIIIRSDSKYVTDAVNQRWIHEWVRNGWMTKGNKPVANKELWENLIYWCKKTGTKVRFEHTAGHSGDKYNDMADAYAKAACM